MTLIVYIFDKTLSTQSKKLVPVSVLRPKDPSCLNPGLTLTLIVFVNK